MLELMRKSGIALATSTNFLSDTEEFHRRLESLVNEALRRASDYEKDASFFGNLVSDLKEESSSYRLGIKEGIQEGELETKMAILGRLSLFVSSSVVPGSFADKARFPVKTNDLLCGSRHYFSSEFAKVCYRQGLTSLANLVAWILPQDPQDPLANHPEVNKLRTFQKELHEWLYPSKK